MASKKTRGSRAAYIETVAPEMVTLTIRLKNGNGPVKEVPLDLPRYKVDRIASALMSCRLENKGLSWSVRKGNGRNSSKPKANR